MCASEIALKKHLRLLFHGGRISGDEQSRPVGKGEQHVSQNHHHRKTRLWHQVLRSCSVVGEHQGVGRQNQKCTKSPSHCFAVRSSLQRSGARRPPHQPAGHAPENTFRRATLSEFQLTSECAAAGSDQPSFLILISSNICAACFNF
jgi:hypothetical protein